MPGKSQIDIFLLPGEYFAGGSQYRIRTLLGSCVSITLWHPQARVGAMSHYLLAQHGGKAGQGQRQLSARYGEDALCLMQAELHRMGVPPRECEAKVFGGGDMFPHLGKKNSVGRKNGNAAHALLVEQGIAVVSQSLYGSGHRQIIFNVSSGYVWSRQVNPEDIVLPNIEENA